MKTKYTTHRRRRLSFLFALTSLVLLLMAVSVQAQLPAPTPVPICERTVKANVVALDQVIMYNRLGTVNPGGMIYALKQDVVAIDPLKGIVAGNVRLRSNKRPRPIVLRTNNGDCLQISFTNLLSPTPKSHKDPEDPLSDQPATRSAGVHVIGTVSYTHLRAHETGRNLVCRLLLEKKKKRVIHEGKTETDAAAGEGKC